MAKKREKAKDIYKKEYGPMETIYIEEAAQKQLSGDERFGKWYLTRRYSKSPTERFCIRTSVPESSLEKGFFHPDRFEPDIRFLIKGRYIEKCDADTAITRRGNTSVLIPKNIEDQSDFLRTVPLGTKVRFRESATRNGKLYKHNFSIEVLEEK